MSALRGTENENKQLKYYDLRAVVSLCKGLSFCVSVPGDVVEHTRRGGEWISQKREWHGLGQEFADGSTKLVGCRGLGPECPRCGLRLNRNEGSK